MSPTLDATATADHLRIDGSLSDAPWQQAAWSEPFGDMETGAPALLSTRAAVVVGPQGIAVGFRVEEPFPSATVFERDGIVFKDNDVEVFVDFGWGYYEFEINAAGTIYEVMHVWRDSFGQSPFGDDPQWTIRNPDVFTFAGDFARRPGSFWSGTHPRGVRIAHRGYDFPGLVAAVHVDGALNDRTQRSRGWSAELLLPWAELTRLSAGRIRHGAQCDIPMFLGRFQQLVVGSGTVTAPWCLSPHGVLDTHQPERFTSVRLP